MDFNQVDQVFIVCDLVTVIQRFEINQRTFNGNDNKHYITFKSKNNLYSCILTLRNNCKTTNE